MKLGFIGTGNMASAIMGGIIKNNVIPAEEIIGADLFAPGRERAQKEYGINVTADNKEVASKAETIILSVKTSVLCKRNCRYQRCSNRQPDYHYNCTW